MAAYWPSNVCVFMDRDQVVVNENAKKITRPISGHLDKGFIIIMAKRKRFPCGTKAGNSERARWPG